MEFQIEPWMVIAVLVFVTLDVIGLLALLKILSK
jgi:hypothetical protein